MPPTVVAFLNFKGGVGKTGNVVNIGASLAATHQKKVLVVDLDPQCNASLWLLGKVAFGQHTGHKARSVSQALRDRIVGTRLFNFDDAVVRGVPRTENGYQQIANLDLLPSTIDLLEVEDSLAHKRAEGAHKYLFQQLQRPIQKYDYVLIDCAPNFFTLTKNAVFLSNHLTIPYIPDFLSLVGFQTLASLVERFGAQIGGERTALGKTRISAIVVNRYKHVGVVFKKALLELEKLTTDLKAKGLIHPRTRVLEPCVRDCVKVAEAPAYHKPMVLYAPESIGGIDYAALTQSFIQHFEGLR